MLEKKLINLEGSFYSNSPYSQAVSYGSLLFVSGMISKDMETGKPTSGSIEEETEQVIKNIQTILNQAGSSLECVLQMTVYLTDPKYFDGMNSVFRKYFPTEKPTRSTVGVQLMRSGIKVEIDVISYIPENKSS